MFWLLTVILFGANPADVVVGYSMFPTQVACEAKIAELHDAGVPPGLSFDPVALSAKCEAVSDPVTEKKS